MNRLQILFQLGLADFRERTRRYSFLITMIGVMFFGYLVITGQYTIQFGQYRTPYNSAWAGTLMAVCSSVMITIIGFYLVRGSVRRDRVTEVGQIIAATQMSGRLYIASKLASNIATLLLMVTSLAALAFVTLLIKNEAGGVSLRAFVSPFLIISLPTSIFVASVALLFDTARWLRGTAGYVIYLFLAEGCVILGMIALPIIDLPAIAAFTNSARAAAETAFLGEKIGLLVGFVAFDPQMQREALKVFPWTGIDWTTGQLLMRFGWIAATFAITSMTVLLFDRFDVAGSKQRRTRLGPRETVPGGGRETSRTTPELAYDSLCPPLPRFRLGRMVGAELRLALKGFHWFWYAVAVGLIAAQCAAPFNIARLYLVPAAMVWPLVIWSTMGTRESRFGTAPLLLSSPSPVRRQFPGIWLAGLLIAAVSAAGMIVRAGIAGEWLYAATLLAAVFLIPTVSLALGTLSGSRRLFEIIYLMVWYIGSIDHLAAIDLLGATDEAVSVAKAAVMSLIAVGSLLVAFAARSRQVRYC